MYLGTISYGIYINHLFLPHVARRVTDALGLPPIDKLWGAEHALLNDATFIGVLGLASVRLAALTWHFFELPVSEWGNRLTSRRAKAGAPRPAPVLREPRLARQTVAMG